MIFFYLCLASQETLTKLWARESDAVVATAMDFMASGELSLAAGGGRAGACRSVEATEAWLAGHAGDAFGDKLVAAPEEEGDEEAATAVEGRGAARKRKKMLKKKKAERRVPRESLSRGKLATLKPKDLLDKRKRLIRVDQGHRT